VREHRLSPAVRRAVTQHNVDPSVITGSGKDGRITRADVDAYLASRPAAVPGSRIVPHDRMRRLIADNMLASVTTAPHVTAVFEADFSAIMAHRAAHKAALGVPLTYTAYIVAACVAAMRAAPAINSRWHADHLELFDDINVGVGTALGDKGLVVPVVHRAQELSLQGIAARLNDLTTRARAGQLKPADMKDGTFSISNHGVSGSLVATPIIIQQPQSAILGVGKLEKRVVVREVDGVDTIQIRPMAYVSLTIDHRVVDGHQTNAWLTAFVQALESWDRDG
jgi:2-oxoglutarate dehydrogenase E2 component (dihydrolipoamide succinyltransferase)